MEIDKEYTFSTDIDVDTEESLDTEAKTTYQQYFLEKNIFPDLKKYYSYILYDTLRIFPSVQPEPKIPQRLLMIEGPKPCKNIERFDIVPNTKAFKIDYTEFNHVYKRKCPLDSRPIKYLKCFF